MYIQRKTLCFLIAAILIPDACLATLMAQPPTADHAMSHAEQSPTSWSQVGDLAAKEQALQAQYDELQRQIDDLLKVEEVWSSIQRAKYQELAAESSSLFQKLLKLARELNQAKDANEEKERIASKDVQACIDQVAITTSDRFSLPDLLISLSEPVLSHFTQDKVFAKQWSLVVNSFTAAGGSYWGLMEGGPVAAAFFVGYGVGTVINNVWGDWLLANLVVPLIDGEAAKPNRQ